MQIGKLSISLASVLLVFGTLTQSAAAEEHSAAPELGAAVELPALSDLDGQPVSAWMQSNGDASTSAPRCTVLFFLGTECPLVKLYASRMEELAQEFSPQGVSLVGVASNIQDDSDELRAFAAEFKLSFPIVKDEACRLADRVGATRTPQVVVLDRKGRIRYRGRIDGQFTFGSGVGLAQPVAKRKDLELALQQLLSGGEVEVAETEARGCLIGRPKQPVASAEVTYCNQIARLFQERCIECHRAGQIGPFALDSYDEAVGWAEMIQEVVQVGRMPPWHANPAHGKFANDARLTDQEKEWIADWVENGCPEGDRADLPTPVDYPIDGS